MVRIKICGITRLEDALICAEAGVDLIGFIFYPGSKRYIEPEKVRKITLNLPPFIFKVGVFVNEDKEKIIDIARYTGIDIIQLHGDESPEYCQSLRKEFPIIKAFRIKDLKDVEQVFEYREIIPLFDTYTESYGGSGKRFNWNLLKDIREKIKYFFLAGGLNIDNVEEAIKVIKPYGIDVSSGVEISPGIKDKDKIIGFVKKVRETGLKLLP